jgi:hypothetical protein
LLELEEPAQHASEHPIRGLGVIEQITEQEEAVGFLPQCLLDGPVEGAEEVLFPKVAALVVAKCRQVGATEVGIPERDQPGH